MNTRFACAVALCVLAGPLPGCSGDSGDAPKTSANASVAVSTVKPLQRPFTDSVDAVGSAISDPRHARTLSLAHGGQVVAIMTTDGESVHAGAPLLKIAADPATRQAYTQAQSALQLARGELTRAETLAAQHLATQSHVDAARKAAVDAQAAVQAQRRLGGAQAIDTITAPDTGVVTAIQVTRSQRVQANAPLLTFTPAHGLIAQLGLQADEAARIAPGMPVSLHAVYGPSDGARGHVGMVGNAVDPTTHLVPVQVTIPNAWATRLVAGAALSAQIRTDHYVAWAVPRQSLRHDDKGDYLFQFDHGIARRVDVTVRSPAGDTVGVDGKLDPQRPVIVLGAYELKDGMAVREQAR